jgi:hypothetical protein
MHGIFAFLAPFALFFPLGMGSAGTPDNDRVSELDPRKAELLATQGDLSETSNLDAFYNIPVQNQVRIERRVTIRIAPQQSAARQNLVADLPQQASPQRLEERKMEKCLPVSGIVGVQTGSGNKLVLYLRDRRMVSAKLEKSCRARDFYSGFYLERNEDGKLCVGRDRLQSRAGAKCEIDRLRQLVAVEE